MNEISGVLVLNKDDEEPKRRPQRLKRFLMFLAEIALTAKYKKGKKKEIKKTKKMLHVNRLYELNDMALVTFYYL